jgi:hypothetical protein
MDNNVASLMRLVRVLFKVLRVFRKSNLKVIQDVRRLVKSFVVAAPGLGGIGALLLLVYLIYAGIGQQFFWNARRRSPLNAHMNFSSLSSTLLLLIRFSTGDNWNGIMHSLMEPKCQDPSDQTHCGSYWGGLFYCLSFMGITMFIILNVFVAVICDSLSETRRDERHAINAERYMDVWRQFDKDNRLFIPVDRVIAVLEALRGPMGLSAICSAKQRSLRLLRLRVPIRSGFVSCAELFENLCIALVHHSERHPCTVFPPSPELMQLVRDLRDLRTKAAIGAQRLALASGENGTFLNDVKHLLDDYKMWASTIWFGGMSKPNSREVDKLVEAGAAYTFAHHYAASRMLFYFRARQGRRRVSNGPSMHSQTDGERGAPPVDPPVMPLPPLAAGKGTPFGPQSAQLHHNGSAPAEHDSAATDFSKAPPLESKAATELQVTAATVQGCLPTAAGEASPQMDAPISPLNLKRQMSASGSKRFSLKLHAGELCADASVDAPSQGESGVDVGDTPSSASPSCHAANLPDRSLQLHSPRDKGQILVLKD